jgi:hypothetical protein
MISSSGTSTLEVSLDGKEETLLPKNDLSDCTVIGHGNRIRLAFRSCLHRCNHPRPQPILCTPTLLKVINETKTLCTFIELSVFVECQTGIITTREFFAKSNSNFCSVVHIGKCVHALYHVTDKGQREWDWCNGSSARRCWHHSYQSRLRR